MIDVFSLWYVLADQAIGVFVEASLPRVIGVSEETLSRQLSGDLFMVSKLSAITPSE